jgi:murein L,D-transpeptidase YafK
MNFKKFKVRKTRIFKTAKDKKIKLYNINISPYSNSQGKSLFRITMDEDYQARYYKFKGIKELYVELKADGKISILIED